MNNLAHFTIDNLNELISERENYFKEDDYVDVNLFIAPPTTIKTVKTFHGFLLFSGSDENQQQISPQHYRLVLRRNLILRTNPHRPTGSVLHIQLENFVASLTQVLSIDLTFLCFSSQTSLSFLVSGNSEENFSLKPLEEINFFDGDANAVSADFTNNVDVKIQLTRDLS